MTCVTFPYITVIKCIIYSYSYVINEYAYAYRICIWIYPSSFTKHIVFPKHSVIFLNRCIRINHKIIIIIIHPTLLLLLPDFFVVWPLSKCSAMLCHHYYCYSTVPVFFLSFFSKLPQKLVFGCFFFNKVHIYNHFFVCFVYYFVNNNNDDNNK